MNYLVTGGAGFIGAAVAERLVKENNNVVTIDNLSTGNKEHIPEGVEFVYGSTADENVIERLSNRQFDAIIHIAGQSSGEVSFENPVYDLQTNCQSTLLLLDLARKTGCTKFVYASSMSVYGDHNPPKCDEDTGLVPKSFYAVGKLASEHYMRIYSQEYGISCTALRLFNTYGIGQNMDNMKQGMASIYLAMAINNHKITVKGSKDRFRDFVYIDDVVEAFIKSIKRTGDYEHYNVCNGRAITVENVINEIKKNMPYKVEEEYLQGTPGDQFGIFGSNKKTVSELGWKPVVSFEEGMKKMVDWALNR